MPSERPAEMPSERPAEPRPADPFPATSGGDPPPEFAERRERAPLDPATLPSGDRARIAVRYADVREVLGSPHFTRELFYEGAPRLVTGADTSDDPDLLLNMDPPRHTRLRRIVAGPFTPRGVERWRPRAKLIAEELVARLAARRPPADLGAEYAFTLPIMVICELLGVPPQDRARFREWSVVALSTAGYNADERRAAGRAFVRYAWELVAERRRRPGEALIDSLIAAHDGGDSLTERELVRMIVTLILAGHETTANVLGRGTFSLLRTGQYEALAADPGLLPGAVEEILRYDMPGDAGLPRVATRDVPLPSGRIRAGETVVTSIAAANRDARVFPDPDRLEITRAECPHLSVGYGAHYCLGANLARMELQVGFAALIERLPGLRLAVPPDEVPWRTGLVMRGPRRLPVTW